MLPKTQRKRRRNVSVSCFLVLLFPIYPRYRAYDHPVKRRKYDTIPNMGKKTLRIGFDFDGVIAYNPFRIIRAPISYVKRNLLHEKKLSFYYPSSPLQQAVWRILHDSSVFPSKGIDLLEKLVKEKTIEAHLITARYSFLDDHLHDWLRKHKVMHLFTTINWNKKDEQPHLFKEHTVKELSLDAFVEDNLDIVKHLHRNTKTKIYWIYNVLDRGYPHPHKHPHLGKALEDITSHFKVQNSNAKSNPKSK